MSTGSHDRSSGIAVPALAKFGEYLQSHYFEELSGIIRKERQINNGIVEQQELNVSLIIEALIENDNTRLTDFLESELTALDPRSIAHGFREIRNLKNQLTLEISAYTSDAAEAIALAVELDALFLAAEDNMRKKLHVDLIEPYEQLKHFNDRITNSIPGIIFILDLFRFKEVYVNRNAEYFFGYSHDDLQEMGSDLMSRLIHPEDIPVLLDKVGDFADSHEGDIRVYEFRLKTKAGDYSWVRSYESVYQRTENGIPRQVIGIAIDITKEKDTSKQLAQREQQLLQAQQIAGIGSFEVEIDKYTGEMTDMALNILQLEAGQSLAMFIDNVHEDDQERVRATINNAIENQSEYDLELRYKADGGFKAVWLKGNVHRQDAKVYIKGTVMDITSRYNLVQQLKKSDQLYKQAEALAHLGNWHWNVNDETIYWSDELYRIHKIDPSQETITYEKYLQFIHPDDKEAIKQTIAHSLATHESFKVYHRVILHDGTIKYIQGWGEIITDENGQPKQMFGTAQDITEKQLLLEQLKESEQLYKEAQALAHIGNWSWDVNNNTILLSDELYRIFELTAPREFDKENFMKNLFPSDRESIEQTIESAIATKEPFEFIYKTKLKSGTIKTLKVLGEVKEVNYTKSLVVIGTCQDITEQELIEHQLRMKQAELEQSNTSLREYAYVASHDLQEPLRKISTFADRLRTSHQGELSETAKSYLEKIISSSIRMQQMIRDLLSVSVINSDRSFKTADLNQLFRDVLQNFEHAIEKKQVTITCDHLPEAKVIPSQIRQLLQNLISNSIKFRKSDVPCHILVTGSLTQDPGDDFKNPIPGTQYLKLEVTDNGIGFNNQFSEKIFTIFQRLHRKQEYEGTGIGLAICKRIAENHNGMIKAFGEEGKGTIVTLIIPA
jgi:PAS domain S-box-containing protein